MAKKDDNEFLRKKPGQHNRNPLFDLTNLIIPIIIVIAGMCIAAQVYCRLMGHDPAYTGAPVHILQKPFLFLPAKYRIYNPFTVFLIILSKPLDARINAVLFDVYFPLIASAGLGVLTFFVVSALRTYGLNRNENLYGTARWATEKDLERFGLTQKYGVVLGEFQRAKVWFKVNPENSSISLTLKKNAPLVCHGGGTNTLMIAPTRSGKGVSSVVPTLLNYPDSMIIFDPKGENFQITAGFRAKFSHVLKFAPLSRETICFNPLEEVSLDENAFADIGLVIGNMFEAPKGGSDSTASFFDNNAKDFLTGAILHVLSCPKYGKKERNIAGVLRVISQAAGQTGGEGEEKTIGDALLEEMLNSVHYDASGKPSEMLHKIVENIANRSKGQNSKVRSDVFSTIFSKMNLFEDPNIAFITSRSDFKLQDFVDSERPISLYLVVPFSDIERIAPVFKLLINFILTKFSRGEAAYGSVRLKHRILFLLDEFPVLGGFPFLAKTMGILAGYGISFYIIVQTLAQIVDQYGENHTFLDNCKTVVVYAPGRAKEAKEFADAIGQESVTKESYSASGSRFAASLDNMNASSQEVARNLMNADELQKLPPNQALVMNQGMPPYLAKKVVYYMDERFKDKAYFEKTGTGVKPVQTRRAMMRLLSHKEYGLPSQIAAQKLVVGGNTKLPLAPKPAVPKPSEEVPAQAAAAPTEAVFDRAGAAAQIMEWVSAEDASWTERENAAAAERDWTQLSPVEERARERLARLPPSAPFPQPL